MLKYIKNKKKIIATLIASGLIINHLPVEAFANEISILNEYFKEQIEEEVAQDVNNNLARSTDETNSEAYKEVLLNTPDVLKAQLVNEINKHLPEDKKINSLEGAPMRYLDYVTSLTAALTETSKDIKILTYCFNLKELRLSLDTSSKDFDPKILATISHLKGLEKLSLKDFGITDEHINNANGEGIALFERMYELKELDLSGNGITNLNSLSSIPNKSQIVSLNLSKQNSTTTDSSITDGSSSSKKQLTDLGPISLFDGLETLDVSINGIQDITPLSYLKKLKSVKLNKNGIYDLTPVSHVAEVEASEQKVVIDDRFVPITMGQMKPSGTFDNPVVPIAYIKNITKDTKGKPASIVESDKPKVVKDIDGNLSNKTGVLDDSGKGVKFDAKDLGFKMPYGNSTKPDQTAVVQYSFNNNNKFNGTIVHYVRENQKPTIELNNNLSIVLPTDEDGNIVADGNATINIGKDVVNSLVNAEGINISDPEYNEQQEGTSLTATKITEPLISSIKMNNKDGKLISIYEADGKDESGNKIPSNDEGVLKLLKDTIISATTTSSIKDVTLIYEVQDSHYASQDSKTESKTDQLEVKLDVIKNTKPVLETSEAKKIDVNELRDDYFEFDGPKSLKDEINGRNTYFISNEEIRSLTETKLFGLIKSNSNDKLIALLEEKGILTLEDKQEKFITEDDGSVTGFKEGEFSIKVNSIVKDGDYEYRNSSIETPMRDTFNLYEVQLEVKDSNGAKNETDFCIITTNYRPTIDIRKSEISKKYQDTNGDISFVEGSNIEFKKSELLEGIRAKDYEDTQGRNVNINNVDQNGMTVQDVTVVNEKGKVVSNTQKAKTSLLSSITSLFSNPLSKTTDSSVGDSTTSQDEDYVVLELGELPTGTYTIKYEVLDSDGNKSHPAEIEFTIEHPKNPKVQFEEPVSEELTNLNIKEFIELVSNTDLENTNSNNSKNVASLLKFINKEILVTYKEEDGNYIKNLNINYYTNTNEKVVLENGKLTKIYADETKELISLPKDSKNVFFMEIEAVDANGNSGKSEKITLSVTNNAPVINGVADVTLEQNQFTKSDLVEGVNINVSDEEDGDITKNIKVFIDGQEIPDNQSTTIGDGDYRLEYKVVDSDENSAERAIANLRVGASDGSDVNFGKDFENKLENGNLKIGIGEAKKNYTPDGLKKLGESAKVPFGYSFKEFTIVEEKATGKEERKDLNTTGAVGSEITHKVKFVYTNSDGLIKDRTLTVIVTNKAPVLSFEEGVQNILTVQKGMDVILTSGIVASDEEDDKDPELKQNLTKNITCKIYDEEGKDTGKTNTKDLEEGKIYTVEYTVTDSDGNQSQKLNRTLRITTQTAGDGTGNNGTGNNNGTTTDTNKPSTDTTKPGTDSNNQNSQNNQDNQNGQDGQNGTSQNGTGDHPNTIFKDMYDLTGERSLSLSEAKEFKKNPLADVQIVENDMGITIEDIEVLGLEEFNPEQDLTGEERVKDYLITYKVKGYNKVATENINVFSLLMGNVSLRNSVLVAENTLEMEVQRKVTVSNEKPEILGSEKATVEKSKPIDALAGVEAKDAEDGDLTSQVTVSPDPASLDTSKVGEVYTLSYTVQDSDGNFPDEPLVRTFEVVEATSDGSQSQNGTQNGTQTGTQNGANGTTDPNAQGKPSNPQTGDSSLFGVSALAVLSGLGLLVLNRKKD